MKTKALHLLLALTVVGCSSKFNENDDKVTGESDETDTEASDSDDDDDDDDDDDVTEDADGDGFTLEEGDCDDDDENVSPDAEEICDGIDNDCDDVIDEAFDSIMETYYEDADNDEFGNPEVSADFCPEQNKDGWVTDNTDCDDSRNDVYPGAEENFEDEVDNDCDDSIDERFDTYDVDIEDLDEEIRFGSPSSIAVDRTNEAHIVFEADGDVMYTKVAASGTFTPASVISEDEGTSLWSSGEFLDVEVDDTNIVHVGYVSTFEYTGSETYVQRELHYATGGAGLPWTDTIVEGDAASDFDLGQYVDIEIHEADIVGTTATLAYLDADNGNARIADVLVSGGTPIIIGVGSGFPDDWTGGWLPPSAMYTSLGIGSDGTHYVAWYDPNAALTLSPQIQYTQYTWDPGSVFPDGFDPFAFDFSGIDLGRLFPSDLSIEQTLVETRTSAVRLEVTNGYDDTNEVPCVAYIDSDTNTLNFGCEGVTEWAGAFETLPIEGYVPSEPDLAISDSDDFYISFYNQTTRDLMLASKRKDAEEWTIFTVDEAGDVGQASSIDIGEDGSIHISYFDATNGKLKYARGE